MKRNMIQWTGLIAGPILALGVYLLMPESYTNGEGMRVALEHPARATAAMGVWMACWWLSEAIPLPATALLPMVFLPIFKVTSISEVAKSYGHQLIFLFMGGFFLSKAMERWNLHRRIALVTLTFFGGSRSGLIAGFMLVSACLSMWVSNTATAIMMLPIALSVVSMLEESGTEGTTSKGTQNKKGSAEFSAALMLGIAYACSIGGVSTLIGSPPNLFLASYIRDHFQVEVTFLHWFLLGFPLCLIFLPLTWLLLTRVLIKVPSGPPAGEAEVIQTAYRALGPPNRGSKFTVAIFTLTAITWLVRPYLSRWQIFGHLPFSGLTDAGIAMLAGLLLFTIPVSVEKRDFVLDWETAVTLPWGILLLFGGGLALAAAVDSQGLGAFLGASVSQAQGLSPLVQVLIVTTLIIFLTELTSNTATTATMVPILAAVAQGVGLNPFLLVFPAALAASFAFMMPVATPPNAIVFGSGKVSIGQMAKAGLWLNIFGSLLITALAMILVPLLFGKP